MLKILTFLILLFTLSNCSSSRPDIEFDRINVSERMVLYLELLTKDYEQMRDITLKYRKKALSALQGYDTTSSETDEAEAVAILTKGLKIIISRPDRDDNMVSKLVPLLRFELTHLNAYQSTLTELTREAIAGIQYKRINTKRRATYYYILLNLISEMKPDIKRKKRIKLLYENIRDAKIEINRSLRSELLLNGMSLPESPSLIAETILKRSFTQKKK